MTSFEEVCFVFALLIILRELFDFGMYQRNCLQCGGRGKHRDDCPLRGSDE